jgi:hypothetical protein
MTKKKKWTKERKNKKGKSGSSERILFRTSRQQFYNINDNSQDPSSLIVNIKQLGL